MGGETRNGEGALRLDRQDVVRDRTQLRAARRRVDGHLMRELQEHGSAEPHLEQIAALVGGGLDPRQRVARAAVARE